MFEINDLPQVDKLHLFEAASNSAMRAIVKKEIKLVKDRILALDGYSDPQQFLLAHLELKTKLNVLTDLQAMLDAVVEYIQIKEEK